MVRSRVLTIGSFLLLSLALAWPAHAQSGPSGHQRIAYDQGYREGFRLGQQDALGQRAFDHGRHNVYRRGDAGYDRRYGRREAYRQAFRSGFSTGYADAFRQVSRTADGRPRAVPRSGIPAGRAPAYPSARGYPDYGRYGYGSFGFDRGYTDGYERGMEDARRNRRFDPIGHRDYRSANRGYDRRYGTRDQYRIQYRDGFRRGYEEGFRDARRYGNQRGRRLPWPF
jgi:hypothetical protein